MKIQMWTLPAVVAIAGLMAPTPSARAADADRLSELVRMADTLVEHARDRYGPKQTPLFVSQLDIDTKHIPPGDTLLYGKGARGGAGPTGNNLQFDSGLIRFLDAVSRVTGDRKYSAAVDEYLDYYLSVLPDPKTGFFPWGDHRGYDVVRDEAIAGNHEFKVIFPPWERLYEANPAAVVRQIESLKLHIYDESRSWAYSRHYPSSHNVPHSMQSSGGAWIVAWSFLYTKTGDAKYLAWANTLADYLWSVRDPRTDLLASHPGDPQYPAYKKDQVAVRATRTEYMAQLTTYAPNLLRAASILGEKDGAKFRKQALAYIRAFTTRMEIYDNGSFYPTFALQTGEPLFERITDGWEFVPQRSEKYPWANSVLGIRAPITLAFSYKMTREEDLRQAFDRLLPLYQLEQFADPDGPRKELPAGLIAQAIVSFLNMHEATGQRSYLDAAGVFGSYAARHYLVDGWVVCGPPLLDRYQDENVDTFRLYSNRGGSAQLALALLRLHLVNSGQEDFVQDNPMCYF